MIKSNPNLNLDGNLELPERGVETFTVKIKDNGKNRKPNGGQSEIYGKCTIQNGSKEKPKTWIKTSDNSLENNRIEEFATLGNVGNQEKLKNIEIQGELSIKTENPVLIPESKNEKLGKNTEKPAVIPELQNRKLSKKAENLVSITEF